MKQIAILGCVALAFTQTLVAGPTNSPPAKPNAAINQDEYEKFFLEMEKLPPAERQAKTKAFLESHGVDPKDLQKKQEAIRQMTPEQRRAKLQGRLDDLRKKKAAGTLTTGDQIALKNLEGWSKQTQQIQVKSPANSTNNPSRTK